MENSKQPICSCSSSFLIHPSSLISMVVHLASTDDIGLRTTVEAPARHPDGTWNIKLTVAVFRPWRGSQATIASDPAFDAAPWFARPRRRLDEEFGPAVAGCRQQGTANSPPSTTKT